MKYQRLPPPAAPQQPPPAQEVADLPPLPCLRSLRIWLADHHDATERDFKERYPYY